MRRAASLTARARGILDTRRRIGEYTTWHRLEGARERDSLPAHTASRSAPAGPPPKEGPVDLGEPEEIINIPEPVHVPDTVPEDVPEREPERVPVPA